MQGHISLLETTAENQAALLMGLDYLVNISYVEVRGGSSGMVSSKGFIQR